MSAEGLMRRERNDPEYKRITKLFRDVYCARLIDTAEQMLVKQGLAHFSVAATGHEGMAALAAFLHGTDYLHLHYRDKALMLAMGIPPEEFFRALLATPDSNSAGRQMSAHVSWREGKITSVVGPIGNNALHAVGVAAVLKAEGRRGISVCAIGDGTTQQGEVLEAIAEAGREALPVLFVVEDNGLAISTRTEGKTFFQTPTGSPAYFIDVPIERCPGSDVIALSKMFETSTGFVRDEQRPQILVVRFERLSDHTNSDDQTQYRSTDELERMYTFDPLSRMERFLSEAGMTPQDLAQLKSECEARVKDAVNAVRRTPPTARTASPVKHSIPQALTERADYTGNGVETGLSMRAAINSVLSSHLARDSRLFLFGQDIEDPKGDVFGVTVGLSTQWPRQVRNSPLSESIIVGTSIGRALAGQRPIAFIQFADFLPLAANQIISELATMYWRTNGLWSCPVVIMAPSGGYKPGLGPFHSQSFEALFAQCPGLNVFVPSTAGDAAGLLNAALATEQPTLFLYPKALLNQPSLATSSDVDRHFVLPGRAAIRRSGDELTLVCWGNTMPLCLEVANRLREEGISIEVIDLRTLSPWDKQTVIESVRRTKRLVVAHEDNLSMGFGAEVVATIVDALGNEVRTRRVGRSDSYIPFNFDQQISLLPSFRSITEACLCSLDLTAEWREHVRSSPFDVLVAGSGPADDLVTIRDLVVSPGDSVNEGDLLAVLEATKAAIEVCAPRSGTITKICGRVGDEIAVGQVLARMMPDDEKGAELNGTGAKVLSELVVKGVRSRTVAAPITSKRLAILGLAAVGGNNVVSTEALCSRWPSRKATDLVRKTGIRSRPWISPDQSLLGMATDAARQVIKGSSLQLEDIGLVVASTATPDLVTPSLASRIYAALRGPVPKRPEVLAFDINAACSGYLYALQMAFDFLCHNPSRAVLIVTAEAPSLLLNHDDPDTACIFGDAATATLVVLETASGRPKLILRRPEASGSPEPGDLLRVPLGGRGHITMNGPELYHEAVRAMERMVATACQSAGMKLDELDYVIPHQANQRILDAVARLSGVQVFSNIENWGNTGSSSIPVALHEILQTPTTGLNVCLAAFGGGLTYAAVCGRIPAFAVG